MMLTLVIIVGIVSKQATTHHAACGLQREVAQAGGGDVARPRLQRHPLRRRHLQAPRHGLQQEGLADGRRYVRRLDGAAEDRAAFAWWGEAEGQR